MDAMNHELHAGDWVEVRSKEEILATLDRRGELEHLPFMPEMFRHCGQRYRVFKRAHKTCDPATGLQGRRMAGAVHLEDLRCPGDAHDGCQAGCLIFWKTAWLRPVEGPGEDARMAGPAQPASPGQGCTEEDVARAVREPEPDAKGEVVYRCQNTQVKLASTPLAWWQLGQYVEDYRSGNVRLHQLAGGFCFFVYHSLAGVGLGIGSLLRGAYDLFQKAIGGTVYPWRFGRIPPGKPTPAQRLNLEEGELVRVKPYAQILETLNQDWKNRGMYFDGEMVPFCGKSFRVHRVVHNIIDEKSCRMIRFKTPSIILENVFCQARYSKCRKFCPRSIYPYWREIWLERLEPAPRETPKRREEQ